MTGGDYSTSFDVGINKPLKDRLRSHYNDWAVEKMTDLAANDNIPVPEREDGVPWIIAAWASIPEATIRNMISPIGFGVYPDDEKEEPSTGAQLDEADQEDQKHDEGNYLIEELINCIMRISL
ncbi:hypothetical protein GN244_ATG07911 [Phytophthora infestans]|uniref:DDE-1 domain-containing protein n=1 Tax=Phytophthora infestans TaxID=4787 RepID=A0A833WKV3_PHYIN|nr:hypothetical protein GN244_ATG07911 [Phytophthora infestans]